VALNKKRFAPQHCGRRPSFPGCSSIRRCGPTVLRTRWSPEVAYFWNSLGIRSPVHFTRSKARPSSPVPSSAFLIDLPTDGFYVMATFLTDGGGTHDVQPVRLFRTHRQPVPSPSVCPVPGSSSPAFRTWSWVNDVFAPGTRPPGRSSRYSREASELTLGVNWYLKRLGPHPDQNWEHDWFESRYG